MQMTRSSAFASLLVAAAAGLLLGLPRVAEGQTPKPAGSAAPLPAGGGGGEATQIFVGGGTRSLFKIAVVPPTGDQSTNGAVSETVSRDLTLSSLFQVLDPKSFVANVEKEGSMIEPSSWRSIGADAVVKGSVLPKAGGQVHLELRLHVVARGAEAVLKKEYDVPATDVRAAVHQFDNEVVKWFTGTAGTFGSRLVFSASTGKGQKSIFAIDSDGQGVGRLPAVSNLALAPAFGPGGVHYAAGLPDGSYALYKIGSPTAVLKHAGLVFGSAFGGGKMAVVISQGGQSDIYVGGADGSGLSKVTGGGINTHPAFGPGGQLAYVSNKEGAPQIFVEGKRISSRGVYNMAPAWCPDPEGLKVLFMGRDGATWDIFSTSPSGDPGSVKRLTQDQGSNTYPACSPDGRQVAFFSTRGGLFLSNPQGQNQQKIASVVGESLRWEGN